MKRVEQNIKPDNIEKFRQEFPALTAANPPVYLDNAATTLKPRCVIDAVNAYYTQYCANIHRGMYESSVTATKNYESARKTAARFIGASPGEIIFTPNTTYAVNLAAHSLPVLVRDKSRRKILIPFSEHHSNILPWINLAKHGFFTEFIRVDHAGRIDMNDYFDRLDRTTAIVAASMVSNVCGVVSPIREMALAAKEYGALFLADAAQSAAHIHINVRESDVDFLAFSGHKLYAPPGSGVLYGKPHLLERLEPLVWGGGTVSEVTQSSFEPVPIPKRLEPGTPDIPAFIGLEKALEFIENIDFDFAGYEKMLLKHTVSKISEIPGLKISGLDEEKEAFFNNRTAIIPFTFEGWGCEDLPLVLDKQAKIAIRSGFHCAQPFVCSISPNGLHRISLAPYNTIEEADLLADTLAELAELA